MFNIARRAFCAFLGILLPVASYGALITQAPTGPALTQVDFAGRPAAEIALGPVAFTASDGTQVQFIATNSFGAAGFNAPLYGLGDNGIWTNTAIWTPTGISFAWVNGGDQGGIGSTMRFDFLSGPVSTVGGLLNYILDVGNPYSDPTLFAIKALDQNGSVLEVFHLEDAAPIRTPGLANAVAFRGISRNAADIYAFEIQGAGAIESLQFSSSPASVPEPGTAFLVMSAVIAFSSLRRARKPEELS